MLIDGVLCFVLCRSLLQRGSVSLVPGGIAEMFLWQEHKEAIKVIRVIGV